MKNILITLGLLGIGIGSNKGSVPSSPIPTPYIQSNKVKPFVDALIYVESRGNAKAFNKKTNACGCLQIRPIMVREINNILKRQNIDQKFSLENRWDCDLSKEMFYIWRNYHHPNSNKEVIARNWNGGPQGYKNPKTEPYWKRVKKQWEN
jgi:hypothetical protein